MACKDVKANRLEVVLAAPQPWVRDQDDDFEDDEYHDDDDLDY